MNTEVFIERSRHGKVFYELKDDRVRVSGRRALESFSIELELHAMSHNVERLSRRFWRPILMGVGIGLICGAMSLLLVFQTRVPFAAVTHFAVSTGILAAVFLGTGLQWIPLVEIIRFKDAVGRTAFDVVTEKSYAVECDVFVEKLQDSIVKCKQPKN
jgi:hypothetical protein